MLLLALAGSPAPLAERLLQLLGNAGGPMRHALRTLGPMRMSDIETAQRRLTDLARELQQRGEIQADAWSHLSVAV
jgi:flagellar motor switch protein FliG